jgi:hypothetical protein
VEKCWESYLVVESWFGDFAANRSIETAVDEKEGPRGRIKMAKDLRVETALEGRNCPFVERLLAAGKKSAQPRVKTIVRASNPAMIESYACPLSIVESPTWI